MKIVFLCGSLEPGHDGVGDYTRRLAAEMVRQGHHPTIIGLNDTGLSSEPECIQQCENIDISVLRLPSVWAAKQRFDLAKKWIDDVNPEWISLQFVIFSFHPKGLPFGLSGFLAELGKGRHWHLMFHELWVGMPLGASKKHILWGWLQREMIKSLILKLKPEVIHTQCWLYFAHLTKLGFKVDYLPLFSNVPVVDELVSEKKTDPRNGKEIVSMVVFGMIHPFAQIEQLVKKVLLYKERQQVEITLTIIGRCGVEQDYWVSVWKAAGLHVEVLGEQSVLRISQILKNASIGISTCAMAMIDKSGTVAAMLAHGLTVLCVAKPWKPRGILLSNPPSGIIELQKDRLDAYMKRVSERSPYPVVSDVTYSLIKILSKV
jgi:hypothetical protein